MAVRDILFWFICRIHTDSLPGSRSPVGTAAIGKVVNSDLTGKITSTYFSFEASTLITFYCYS